MSYQKLNDAGLVYYTTPVCIMGGTHIVDCGDGIKLYQNGFGIIFQNENNVSSFTAGFLNTDDEQTFSSLDEAIDFVVAAYENGIPQRR